MDNPLYWLKGPVMEAGFSADSGIRLAVLRRPGGENLFRESPEPTRGLKTWIMTPSEDLELRDLVSESPGTAEWISDQELHLSTDGKNSLNLRLEWQARLDTGSGSLEILHRLHYDGELPLHLAAWSIAAFGPGTVIRVPFSRTENHPKDHPNKLAVFPFGNVGDSRIHSDREALSLALREGDEDGHVKLGLVQHAGRLFVERGDTVLESTVPYDPGSDYPEGGSNITVYASPANNPDPMGEAEHVGALRILKKGQSNTIRQTLRLFPAVE